MEDPRYPNMDQLSFVIDPILSFQFPQSSSGLTPLPQNMSDSTYQSDVFSKSYLQNLPTFNPDDNLFDGMPKSSHDDLNQFFNDASFGGGTPGALTPGAVFRYGGEKQQEPLGNSWLRNVQQSAPDWESQNNDGLAVDTSENVEQRVTLVKNGQVTPGNSPSSPKSAQSQSTARKTGRPRKATKTVEGAVSVAPAPSTSDSVDAPAPAPAKRARKPRKNARKPPTPEQEAAKRETFLKRNREAAYKCRIKKKTETEMIVERAKQLDADNAMKGLEIENLRREVESMRAMLLPHWRTCADENVNEYVDGLVKKGWGLGRMVLGAVGMGQREAFDAGEEPGEDDGMNDGGMDGEEMNESPTESSRGEFIHPRDEDVDEDTEEPAHKRRRSEAVFEMSMDDFKNSIAVMDGNRQRRESFFGNSLAPEEVLKDALSAGRSLSSSGSATPALRLGGMDMLNEEFLADNTPPPLDLSAPDEQ